MKLLYSIVCLICLDAFTIKGQNVDTKHLSLQLQFDWQKRQAFGMAEITAAVLKEGDKIYLDAGLLSIQYIELNNQKLQFNYDGGEADNGLEIVLNRLYKPHEIFTLKIDYRTNYENRADPNAIGGSFGKGLRFFQPTSTTPQKRKQIWSSGEPEGNKYWFPCNEDIADIHTTEIKAILEKPLMLISNGVLTQVDDNHQDHTRTYHYTSDQPFPNYLVSIVVGEYTEIILRNKQTFIASYGYPDEQQAVGATVELLPDMMQFLEEKTGYPYPFKQYSQVVVQDYPYPGLVGQHTAALLSDNYIDDYGVHKDFKYLWDGVAVQALANQWFGNLIMPKSWEDLWLNNAFAQYFAGLYTIKDNSKEEYLLWYYPFEKTNVVNDWNAGNRHPIVPEKINNLEAFTTDSYSKFRGALVLRMLQKEMGEKNWWEAVQHYVKTNAGKQAGTKDFQDAIEKIAGKSYQWFFEQWIYKAGLPKFEVKKEYNAAAKELLLSVEQIQQADEQVLPFFEGHVEVETGNQTERIYIKPQANNVFRFAKNQPPQWVHFNVEETFLCETIFEKTTDEYVQQMRKSNDVLAKKVAMDQLVETAKDSSTSAALKAQIIGAITAEFQSGQYWRYRWYALGALQRIFTLPYSDPILDFLVNTIQKEKSWIKSTAINMLGKTNDAKYKEYYINALNDESDRVINAAANALGKTKSPVAYGILLNLENQASWKNQNRISALNGLQQLGDGRAVDYALKCLADNQSPRWYLATPVWDYPFAAVNTLLALGKADLAYPLLYARLQKSLEDNDINDIFQNVQLIDMLKDVRGKEIYELLRGKFKDDPVILADVLNYEKQFLNTINR